ncbi:MAG: Fic family protein [Planctomycetes bacterium]|nr:Fic family protein [Planctomycetota bacterium]
MSPEYAYRWKPIEPPSDVRALAIPELRAFEKQWQRQRERLEQSKALARFWEHLARRWSIETGIIERVYDLSLGATETLVEQGFLANLIQHGDSDTDPERLIAILNDHRDGLRMVMDLIGGTREFTTGWIKELHVLLCRHQNSVTAREQGGLGRLVEVRFEHGVYKKLPNSPTLEDGRIHEYCPPEHVASEMDRMMSIYRDLPGELPEVRSAWVHHAFTQIHPFQDGNGRVARSLASVDFIRSGLFPLVVDRSQRDTNYMPALRAADAGDLRPLTQFFAECQQQAIFRALSHAEDVLERTTRRATIFEAAQRKREHRSKTDAETRSMMRARLHALAASALEELRKVGKEAESRLRGVKSDTQTSDASNQHYWRQQIVDMAKRRKYWVDFGEERCWARLQLRDGGITDLVIVMHFVGNPSPGTCLAAAFLQHRDSTAQETTTGEFTLLPQEPLLLVPDEDEALQASRYARWLDETIVVALTEWQKRL